MRVWYRVSNLGLARAFYTDLLGFRETFVADEGAWVALDRDKSEIALAEGEPQSEGGVATVDVEAERERLEGSGVRVGTVLELQGAMRLLDVYDPDGNRIQLAEDVS